MFDIFLEVGEGPGSLPAPFPAPGVPGRGPLPAGEAR